MSGLIPEPASAIEVSHRPLRLWHVVALLAFLCGMVGCEVKANVMGSGRVRDRIRRELGAESAVSFHMANGATTVSVTLFALPRLPPATVRARVDAIVRGEMASVTTVEVMAKL